jgi:GntR family transcriptional regulator
MAQPPMYQQIAEDLRAQIAAGTLAPGTRLPTELELSDRHAASRNTVRDAIKRLMSQGLVESRPGLGTFVTRTIEPFVTVLSPRPATGIASADEASETYLSSVHTQPRQARASAPKVEVLPCPREIALRLRVMPGVQVISRHQVCHIDETPWLLQTSFYPLDFITAGAIRLLLAEDISEGTVKYLASALGLEQVGYQDWVTVRGPDNTERAFFGLMHDATVFELFRTAYAQDQRPTRVTVTAYPADRNQIVFNFGDVPNPEYTQAR